MLLAIDIGNTSTTIGLFKKNKLVLKTAIDTIKSAGVSDISRRLKKVLPRHVQGFDVIIASVVPELDKNFRSAIKGLIRREPLFIDHRNAGIRIAYPRPKEVGADRLVDAVAAWKRFKRACIVVDFGTATTFDYIDGKGRYFGGPIVPGIITSSRALSLVASKLPRFKVEKKYRMLPKTTIEAMQTGVFQGYMGLITHILKKMAAEVKCRPLIIATGGLASLLCPELKMIKKQDIDLTLHGLRIVYENIRKNNLDW